MNRCHRVPGRSFFVLLSIVSIPLSSQLSPLLSLILSLILCVLLLSFSFPSATTDILLSSLTFSSLFIILFLCYCLSPLCLLLSLDLHCLIRVWPKQWTYCCASERGLHAAGHYVFVCVCVFSHRNMVETHQSARGRERVCLDRHIHTHTHTHTHTHVLHGVQHR